MMHLKWLEALVALEGAGSFSLAAQKRCLSQPALSRQIQSLEKWASVPLVDRDVQPVQMTAAGRELCMHARYILTMLAVVQRDFKSNIR
ncbi:HTH-type transcriptional regulator CatM [Ralstonia wenshanensis]|jgi:DNA-binding transcriptional LysR family regulator|nr:HTH-type transcriptional regulator CatM [Ralstonia wenshanensis]